jgi:hypothetical protein
MFFPLVALFLLLESPRRLPKLALLGVLVFDLIGTNASGNPSASQLRQSLPSLSLLAALGLAALVQRVAAIDLERCALLAILSVALVWLPLKELRVGLLNWKRGTRFDDPASTRSLGLWIKQNTGESEYVYVFDRILNGLILSYAERRSPGRHFSTQFLFGPRGEVDRPAYQQTLREVVELAPSLILVPVRLEAPPFRVPDDLQSLLDRSYTAEGERFGYRVFRLSSRTPASLSTRR